MRNGDGRLGGTEPSLEPSNAALRHDRVRAKPRSRDDGPAVKRDTILECFHLRWWRAGRESRALLESRGLDVVEAASDAADLHLPKGFAVALPLEVNFTRS